MARVIHFEVPVDDPERARRFYEAAFGWSFDGSGDEAYWLAATGDDDEPGIHGALISRSEVHASPVLVVGVPSLDDAVARAETAGGSVLVAKHEIPSVGWSAYVRDPDGNVVGLFEAVAGEPPPG